MRSLSFDESCSPYMSLTSPNLYHSQKHCCSKCCLRPVIVPLVLQLHLLLKAGSAHKQEAALSSLTFAWCRPCTVLLFCLHAIRKSCSLQSHLLLTFFQPTEHAPAKIYTHCFGVETMYLMPSMGAICVKASEASHGSVQQALHCTECHCTLHPKNCLRIVSELPLLP